jgi:hypothetical protein
MDNSRTSAVIGRINALLARAAKARREWQAATAASNERRQVLAGAKAAWRRKCDDWLKHRSRGAR